MSSLCVQQDGFHRSRGDLQLSRLAVSVCLLLLLEQGPFLRVELSLGHPAAWGDCHLPLWLCCALGWSLASDPCRYVWSLTLTRVVVMQWGHLWFCYRWRGEQIAFAASSLMCMLLECVWGRILFNSPCFFSSHFLLLTFSLFYPCTY